MSDQKNNIRVDVETQFIDGQSDPDSKRFVFAYTVTIHNEGSVPAQLLSRHWIITDANGKEREVHGAGVVGERPSILPGQGYQYSSGAVLATPVGTMHGSYQMVSSEGEAFNAAIEPFSLAIPGYVH
ncbi:MAG: Co2+/Mg2+ efflux protein ApaG [Pseudomonadota bacterium]